MSEDLRSISHVVMEQINKKNITIRPRIYFLAGSFVTFVGLVASVVSSVFFVGIMRFALRSHGPMASYRLEYLLDNFPWWAPILAIGGFTLGIWLLRQYDFSFKIKSSLLVLIFLLSVVAGGLVIDILGINDLLVRRGVMQGLMKPYMQNYSSLIQGQFDERWLGQQHKENINDINSVFNLE